MYQSACPIRRINREWPAAGSCHFAEGDLVAEVLKLLDEAVLVAGGVASAGEVVASEVVVVVTVVGGEMPGDDHRDGRSSRSEPLAQTPELSRQIGVGGAGCSPGAP
jgi:hypothetical protein